jgi:two-component system CheB/CheR fusion protein
MTTDKTTSDQRKTGASATAPLATADQSPARALTIVGIGASAGGLEAYEMFFRHLPPESGLAFVLVPHLDPGHESILGEILQRSTTMPVREAEDQLAVAPNTVYVIPPNRDMAIGDGKLQVSLPELPRGRRMPIDAFLRTLAEACNENAVGIVLSGTGTDGTQGLRAIHGAGGLTLAQEPSSAKYSGMPESAIRSGYASHVVAIEDMPTVLLASARAERARPASATGAAATAAEYGAVLSILRTATGHDFSLYKKGTIGRRIARRMLQSSFTDIDAYAAYLAAHPDEVQLLFKDLLINVTRFFRDAEAFDALRDEILPQLLANKPDDYVFRVWVAGCSTGEEAYSIAILLREFMAQTQQSFKMQIYGTDLDQEAIAVARNGFYPPNIAADLTPERLQRFFLREDAAYRVRKEIREMLVFAVQNVIKDPPFTKLDLISCRNVMIYLEAELQSRLIPTLHYALKPNGVLFLSPAESIADQPALFRPLSHKWKFYRAIGSGAGNRALLVSGLAWPKTPADNNREATAVSRAASNIAQLARRALLSAFAPPSVVTDSVGNILFVYGETGKYLRPAPGAGTLNVVDMAHNGLQLELRAALRDAAGQGPQASVREVMLHSNGEIQKVAVSVRPLSSPGGTQQSLLVSFQDLARAVAVAAAPASGDDVKAAGEGSEASDGSAARRTLELESDLAQTWESLQATIERQQISTEELMSTNEELQATNEELQSTVEELETSKEELQSVNEEMVTVNAELQANIDQLGSTQDDLRNLLDNVSGGLLFLDEQLLIRRFTSAAADLYPLVATDVGRPLADIRANIVDDQQLLADAKAVLASGQACQREVQTRKGLCYQARLKPYRRLDNRLDGLVITFTDISARVAAESQSQAAQHLAESIVDTLREPLLVLDGNLTVVSASRSFYQRFQVDREASIGRRLYDLGDGQWNIPALRELLATILSRDQLVEEIAVDCELPAHGPGKMLLNARRIPGEAALILLAMEEIPRA